MLQVFSVKASQNLHWQPNTRHGTNALQNLQWYYPKADVLVSNERCHVASYYGLQHTAFVTVEDTRFVGYGGGQRAATEDVANTALNEMGRRGRLSEIDVERGERLRVKSLGKPPPDERPSHHHATEKLLTLAPEAIFAVVSENQPNADGSLNVVASVSIRGNKFLAEGDNKDQAFENAAVEALKRSKNWTRFDKKQRARSAVVGHHFHNRRHTLLYKPSRF